MYLQARTLDEVQASRLHKNGWTFTKREGSETTWTWAVNTQGWPRDPFAEPVFPGLPKMGEW